MSNSITIRTPADLGKAIRLTRKRIAALRQAETARLCRVSPPFLGKLENGGDSVHLGKTLEVCRALGIELDLRLPTDDPAILEELRRILEEPNDGEG